MAGTDHNMSHVSHQLANEGMEGLAGISLPLLRIQAIISKLQKK